MAPAGRPKIGLEENPISKPITLAEAGIDKNLAHQARTLGKMSEEKFEQTISSARDAVSRAAKNGVMAETRSDAPPKSWPTAIS